MPLPSNNLEISLGYLDFVNNMQNEGGGSLDTSAEDSSLRWSQSTTKLYEALENSGRKPHDCVKQLQKSSPYHGTDTTNMSVLVDRQRSSDDVDLHPPTTTTAKQRVLSQFEQNQETPNQTEQKQETLKSVIKMEELVDKMQQTDTGIPVKTVQNFMTKVPSVFTGADLIAWVQQNVKGVDQIEGLHLCHMIAAHGYVFPIDDHILTVKNDGTHYRFQTKCFWLSRCHEPDNTDYAVYLCKRTMQNKQRLELVDYEAEHLARLQKMFARKWEFIFMQAEAQVKVDKKRDKVEKKILDSQERAFWDLHRPAPGCINTTEVDIKKACKMDAKHSANLIKGCPDAKGTPKESLTAQITYINRQIERRRQKVSKVAESLKSYTDMYSEFDPMISQPDQGNPWITESTEFWDTDQSEIYVPRRRYKRWGFSILELLRDPAGKEEFLKFLNKEFSGENMKFWMECRELKSLPMKQIKTKVAEIYVEYLVEGASNAINVDSQVAETVRKNVVSQPSRYCFDAAEEHIFTLMKNDKYNRFIRSEQFKEYVNEMKKNKATPNKLSIFTPKNVLLMASP